MTQPPHGASRAEVSDLRNIVDRLDLLMGGPGPTSHRAGGRQSPHEVIAALGERIEALEGELDELRTLVNHLMTIATWQAKVTATLVDDRADEEVVDDDVADERVSGQQPSSYGGTGPQPTNDHRGGRDGASSNQPQHTQATTLDDDIDEILGGDRSASQHDPPPPDFGI